MSPNRVKHLILLFFPPIQINLLLHHIITPSPFTLNIIYEGEKQQAIRLYHTKSRQHAGCHHQGKLTQIQIPTKHNRHIDKPRKNNIVRVIQTAYCMRKTKSLKVKMWKICKDQLRFIHRTIKT